MAWAWQQTDENTGSTTLSVTLPSGTGRKIFFILAWEYSGKTTISSIDFGGSTPTLISDGTNTADVPDTNNNTAAGYYFDIPDAWTGAKTLTITFAATVTKNVTIANTYTGIATGNADVVQTYQSAGSSISANTLNITPTATTGVIISGAGTSSNINWTPGTGETERGDGKSGGNGGCGTEKGHTSSAANSTTQTSGINGRYQQWNSAWSEASGSTNVEILAKVDPLTLATLAANVNAETNISAKVDALSLVTYAANVNLGVVIAATTDALILTEYVAGINAAVNINSNVHALAINTFTANVSLGVTVAATTDALALTTYTANINAGTKIAAGVDNLGLVTYAANVNAAINVNATTAALIVATNIAGINAETNIAAGVASLTLAEYAATIAIGGNRDINATTFPMVLATYNATIAAGAPLTNRRSGSGSMMRYQMRRRGRGR